MKYGYDVKTHMADDARLLPRGWMSLAMTQDGPKPPGCMSAVASFSTQRERDLSLPWRIPFSRHMICNQPCRLLMMTAQVA